MTGEKETKAIVQRLLAFRIKMPQTAEGEKWDETLVRSLVKKLKKLGKAEQLETVLLERNADSPCITIAQPRDGRLQVSTRKCHPCAYCKMWRFPSIETHQQLRCLDSCLYAFTLKLDWVCINPYHFEEVRPLPSSSTSQRNNDHCKSECNLGELDDNHHCKSKFDLGELDDDRILVPAMDQVTLIDDVSLTDLQLSWPPSPESFSPLHSTSMLSEENQSNFLHTTSPCDNNCFQSDDINMQDIPTIAELDQILYTIAELDQILRTTTTLPHIIASRTEAEPSFWAHVYYYEFMQRVGEVFKASGNELLIDGYTSTSEAQRFCLGALGNVNRNPACLPVRKQIGRGCRIVRRNNDYILECLNEGPVFVQSPICAEQRHEEATTVYRLPFQSTSTTTSTTTTTTTSTSSSSIEMNTSTQSIEIFNAKEFDRLLHKHIEEGYSAVYSLQRMCHVRISFIKGWGCNYRRQSITATPCWVEILLPLPMQKLDRVLAVMGGPTEIAHSYT